MTLKEIHSNQPDIFEFSDKNQKAAEDILKKYPSNKKKKCSYAVIIFSPKTK